MDNDDTVHRLDRRPRQNGPSPDFSEANGSWQSPKKTDALRSAYHRGRVAGLREAERLADRFVVTAELLPLCGLDENRAAVTGQDEAAGRIWEAIRSAADKLEAETPSDSPA